KFDRGVRSMIKDKISSFRIRWLALHIRKRAKAVRREGARVVGTEAQKLWPRQQLTLRSLDWDTVPREPGVYWLQAPSMPLYVGETFNLRQRLEVQLKASRFDFWDTDRREITVRFRELPKAGEKTLMGHQSWWITRLKPVGNYAKFAIA